MKFFLAIVALAAVVLIVKAELTQEQAKLLKSYHEQCVKESGVSSEIVANAREGKFSDDAKLKDHLLCVTKKIGFMNDAGEFQKDVLLEKIGHVISDAGVLQKLLDECLVKKSTPVESVFEFTKCYYAKTPKHIKIL